MSALARLVKRRPEDDALSAEQRAAIAALIASERERERARMRRFHLVVREALVMILRAYEGQFLPDLKNSARQSATEGGIGQSTTS